MTRISGGGLGRNPFGHVEAKRAAKTETLQQQVEGELFGKKKPQPVDDDSALAEARLAKLSAWVKKLARLADDDEDDYSVRFAKDTIAMIDQRGVIYVGVSFLDEHEDNTALVVGVLAHEVGHRPKRWSSYKSERATSKEDLAKLCRLEETRADYFAGRALAAFALDVDPVCRFLIALSDPKAKGAHDYFPAPLRTEVIREGFADGRRQDAQKRSMFPELAKLWQARPRQRMSGWKLPLDAPERSAILVRTLLEREDLPPSSRALIYTVRLWSMVVGVAGAIGFVLAICATIALAVLLALLDRSTSLWPLVVCAASAGVFACANRVCQHAQELLFERMLRPRRLVDSAVGGAAPVALPATRTEPR